MPCITAFLSKMDWYVSLERKKKTRAGVVTNSRFHILESDDDDVDFNTEQIVERNATSRRIIRDEDDNGGGKLRAIEERVIEQPSKKPPLVDLTNDDDIKPKAKAQRTLNNFYARKPPAIKLNNLRTAPLPRTRRRIRR